MPLAGFRTGGVTVWTNGCIRTSRNSQLQGKRCSCVRVGHGRAEEDCRLKRYVLPLEVVHTTIQNLKVYFPGISIRVNLLEFSDDGKFLLGCGEDSLLYVWEIFSGEVVYCQRFDKPVSVVKWCHSFLDNRRTSYELAVGYGSTMSKGYFFFDASRVQWTLQLTPFNLPSGGLTRFFASIEFSEDKKYVYVGSTGADLLVYRQDLGVYRAMIPVGSNGVRALLRLPNGDLLCGGGNGVITTLRGEDLSWEAVESVRNNLF